MRKRNKIFILLLVLFVSVFGYFIPKTLSKYTNSLSNTISVNFSRPQYTIKFNSNGGSGSMSDMTVKYDVSQNLTTNSFTRSGYDFIGWNTAANGSGTSYTNGQEVNNLSTTEGDEITLYA